MPISYTTPGGGQKGVRLPTGRLQAYPRVRPSTGNLQGSLNMVNPLGGAGFRPTAAQLRAASGMPRTAALPSPIQPARPTADGRATAGQTGPVNPLDSGGSIPTGAPPSTSGLGAGFHTRYQDASIPMMLQHPDAILADVMAAMGQNPNGAQFGMEAPYAPLAQALYMASGQPPGSANDQVDWYSKFFGGLSGPAGSNLDTGAMIRNILSAGGFHTGGDETAIHSLIAGLQDPGAQVDAVNSLLSAVMNYGIGPIMQQALTNNMNQMEREYYRQRGAVGAPAGANNQDYYDFLRARQHSALINAFT